MGEQAVTGMFWGVGLGTGGFEMREGMLARNTSASDDLKIIVFQVGAQGKPMMIKAD
jgi:hypothetical protein